MSGKWAITIRPPFIEKIVSGVKAYEIRTRVPRNLDVGDDVYVVQAASGGKVVLVFNVRDIFVGTPERMWELYKRDLGVSEGEFNLYTANRESVYLIKMEYVRRLVPSWTLEDLQLLRAPQWFTRVKICRHTPHSALLTPTPTDPTSGNQGGNGDNGGGNDGMS